MEIRWAGWRRALIFSCDQNSLCWASRESRVKKRNKTAQIDTATKFLTFDIPPSKMKFCRFLFVFVVSRGGCYSETQNNTFTALSARTPHRLVFCYNNLWSQARQLENIFRYLSSRNNFSLNYFSSCLPFWCGGRTKADTVHWSLSVRKEKVLSGKTRIRKKTRRKLS